MAGRVRNFTTDTKNKLLGCIENNNNDWNQIGDWFGDRWMNICGAFHGIQLQDDMSNVESYHREIIDKNNTSSDSIKKIFNEVNNIEDNYAGLFRQNTESLFAYQSIVSKLQDCIGDSNFASNFNRNAWQLKMADDFNMLTQMHWEEIMNKKPENITDAEYQKVAYVLLTTNDPKILEGILNKCYVQDTTYPVSDEDPTNTRSWLKSPKLKKIYETMQAMTLSLIYDAPNASDEKVTALINNGVIDKAVQRSQLMLTFLKNDDIITTYVGLKDRPIFSLKTEARNYVITYDAVGSRYDEVSEREITVYGPDSSYSADEINKIEHDNYISSHYGLQEQDITNSLDSAAVKYGSGKVVDTFLDMVPGSNYVKAAKDGLELASAPLTKAKEVADFQKINDIGDLGSIADLFNLEYISSDINNDPCRHCFSLYPTIKDSSHLDFKSTAECLNNFNNNLLYNPEYKQYRSDTDFSEPLTMQGLLNNPKEVVKLVSSLLDITKGQGSSLDKLTDCPCPSQYLPK